MNKSQSMKFGIVLKRTPSIQEYNKAQQIPISIPITEKPSENIVKEMVLKIEKRLTDLLKYLMILRNNQILIQKSKKL